MWFKDKETPFLNRQELLFNTLFAMFESWMDQGKTTFAFIGTSPGLVFMTVLH